MGVMSVRLYCFWQPSELQPSARSLEELQIESITIYFDAWESLGIDLGWWQFPRKCWGNQSGWCAGTQWESLHSGKKMYKKKKRNTNPTGPYGFTSLLLTTKHLNTYQELVAISCAKAYVLLIPLWLIFMNNKSNLYAGWPKFEDLLSWLTSIRLLREYKKMDKYWPEVIFALSEENNKCTVSSILKNAMHCNITKSCHFANDCHVLNARLKTHSFDNYECDLIMIVSTGHFKNGSHNYLYFKIWV